MTVKKLLLIVGMLGCSAVDVDEPSHAPAGYGHADEPAKFDPTCEVVIDSVTEAVVLCADGSYHWYTCGRGQFGPGAELAAETCGLDA